VSPERERLAAAIMRAVGDFVKGGPDPDDDRERGHEHDLDAAGQEAGRGKQKHRAHAGDPSPAALPQRVPPSKAE
jgi:hypothetical protein